MQLSPPDSPIERTLVTIFANMVPALAGTLAARGYDTLTAVQTAVLAPEADGADLLVSAQTGSGKTVAFGIAIAPTLLGERRALRGTRCAQRADHRADPRTRDPGPPRTRMAVQGHRRAPRLLRRRHGHAPGAPRAGTGRAYRRRHAGPVARPHHARLARYLAASRRRARRSRRDARPRFSRGSRIHPRRRPRRPPHADVFRHRAETHRASGQTLPARRAAHHRRRRKRPARRYRVPHHTGRAVGARKRHHQFAAVFRRAERAGLLRHARGGQAFDQPAGQSRLFGRVAVGRTKPGRAHQCAAVDARRPRPHLRSDRCRRTRHRPAQSRPRHPCRSADQPGNPAPSQRSHRPRRPQGHLRADRAVIIGAAVLPAC